MKKPLALVVALAALGACSSGGHNELPPLGGSGVTANTYGVVSPSYKETTTTTIPLSVVTPPPTPDWRVAPPTVLVYVTEAPPAPAHVDPPRPRRTDPPPPQNAEPAAPPPAPEPSPPPTAAGGEATTSPPRVTTPATEPPRTEPPTTKPDHRIEPPPTT